MKKIFILTTLMCATTTGANAACYLGNVDTGVPVETYCIDESSGCTYRTCNGNRVCAKDCTDFGTTSPECFDWCPYAAWISLSTGYETRCITTSGLTGCEYRCAPNYYGTAKGTGLPTASGPKMSGCTACPSSGGVAGKSAAGTTAITGCYIPSGSSFSDSTGGGTYTADCYWTE